MSCHTPVLEPFEQQHRSRRPRRRKNRASAPSRSSARPNSGKSTLFNRLTGMRQKVANYPGVTVEHHSGRMKSHRPQRPHADRSARHLRPATYSEDARVAVDVLTGKMPGVPKPDCVLLVLDATHMNRQLMLAAPVFSIGLPTHGAAEYVRPDGGPRRQAGHARPGPRTRPSGRADQRLQGQRPRRHPRIPAARRRDAEHQAPSRCNCPSCRRPPPAAPGPRRSPHAPTISRPPPRCGRAVWTPCCCIASPVR